MTVRCPVSGKTAADAASASSDAVAQCPFASAAAHADPPSKGFEAGASQTSAKATCPYGFGSRANDEAASGKEGAVCPMGFGSSASPKDPLAALQCTRYVTNLNSTMQPMTSHITCCLVLVNKTCSW